MPPTCGPRHCATGRIRLACETPTSYNNTGSGSGRLAAASVPTGPNGWSRGTDVVHCDGAEPPDGVVEAGSEPLGRYRTSAHRDDTLRRLSKGNSRSPRGRPQSFWSVALRTVELKLARAAASRRRSSSSVASPLASPGVVGDPPGLAYVGGSQ